MAIIVRDDGDNLNWVGEGFFMNKVRYMSTPEPFQWDNIHPWCIIRNLLKYRELTLSMTIQSFRATYRASYFGMAWQIMLPLIMLFIFYFVFGVIMGGRFAQQSIESPLEYALALFVGLSFFNFVAQTISTAPSLIVSNQVYVKNFSFPLEVIPLVSVLNAFLTLMVNLAITIFALLIMHQGLHLTTIYTVFYIGCAFMMALGCSWGLSAAAVFFRDFSALVSPLTLILMFMCPIFYPASMVPNKIKWVISINPLAVMIEDVRSSLLYAVPPRFHSMLYVFIVSLIVMVMGYHFFMRSKRAFADVI